MNNYRCQTVTPPCLAWPYALLQPDPKHRFGVSGGTQALKQHGWFQVRGLSWWLLRSCTLMPGGPALRAVHTCCSRCRVQGTTPLRLPNHKPLS